MPVGPLTFVVFRSCRGGRCRVEWEPVGLVQGEGLVSHPDHAVGKVRPVDFPLFAELDQQLDWLHGVAPLVVSARVVTGSDAASGPVPAVEPVLQVDLGLANQVV